MCTDAHIKQDLWVDIEVTVSHPNFLGSESLCPSSINTWVQLMPVPSIKTQKLLYIFRCYLHMFCIPI